ncbi:MAG TPA: peptidyl-prolyl cis-trans isomerase [Polyangiaceae bacterium]|nr:peptidyl-prolyl cis-trans isomerase [Polyangiaceae bacterium]
MRLSFVAMLALCLASTAALAAVDDVIVTVGDAKLSGATLAERLNRVPAFQLSRYGSSPEAARKGYVDQVVVPELLFASEAKQRKLEDSPGLRDRVRDLLRDAMERSLRDELAATPISADEIKAYFESNRGRFETPKRVRIWRILVADEGKAKEIIVAAKGADGLLRWQQLARESSLDKPTAMRNGDLGFVRPDGSTDAPRVKVAPEILAAAEKLADGAVGAVPVREGDKFAVVWRRGSMPEVKRTLEQEEASIRQLLERKRADEARSKLLASLKQAGLKESHPELLEHIDSEAFGTPPKRKPPREKSDRRPSEKPKSAKPGPSGTP